ncbi:MAG TPA: pyridoxine 5'-phosphate synthase [Elusimicrobiota bacterium]|nr:pyridoxine 5'-phosphate synthase [Elusimicrobiota bacterium]
MARLGVNIDHIATLRQARRAVTPDILQAALAAERGGADGITVHLREDRRHIQDRDVSLLKKNIQIPLNMEMAATEEMLRIARVLRPHSVCIVPERREELTTEGGLNVTADSTRIRNIVQKLRVAGIEVSLFVDPDALQIEAAKEVGAHSVEIHTGRFANAKTATLRQTEMKKIQAAGTLAVGLGLVLNAGHGLDYDNVRHLAILPGLRDLNIGFAIVARAVFVGMEGAVREMKDLLK